MSTIENNPSQPNETSLPNTEVPAKSRQGMTVAFTLSTEMAAWMTLALAAFVTRFWNLGARVMSHDESLHVYYSWFLSKGSGYSHNPMMHGPFLFEATALINAIFGANDFTSRFLPALLGIGIVIGIPILLRPWLGRMGAFAASFLFLVSPYVMYYSRYNRHDVQVIAWSLLAFFFILAYLRERREIFLLLLAGAVGLMLSTMEISFFYLAIFAGFIGLRILALYRLDWKAIRNAPEWDLLVVLATLGAFFSAPIALLALNPGLIALTGKPFVDLSVLSSYGIEWSTGEYGPRIWGLMAFFWLVATAVGLLWNLRTWPKLAAIFLAITLTLYTTFFTNPSGIGTGFIGSLGYWLSQHDVERGSQPIYFYLVVFPLYEYLPLLAGLAAMAAFTFWRRLLPEPVRVYVMLASFWAIGIFLGLSIAGEKMPWLSVHITTPYILLAAFLSGQVLDRLISWLADRRAGTGKRIPWGTAAGGLVLLVLLLMTARTSFLLNFVHYDYTTEFAGYAHSAPGVKWVMQNIEQIAQRTGQGKEMIVAYDSAVSWPMTWYLRDHPGFFGDQPNRGALANAPVVIASSKNWQKTEAYLGRDYYRYELIRMWWPMEDYKNLSWERIRGALSDPEMRSALWDIFWSKDYRKYGALTGQAESLNPPLRWILEDRMRVYIRKDLADQGITAELRSGQLEEPLVEEVDAYAGMEMNLEPIRLVQPSGLNGVRNLAIAPDGSIFVADSGNSRILHLDQNGTILKEWGSRTIEGQNPPAPSTFNEPWGLALDAQGNIYVADTWNHRIQKFDSEGQFLLEWGSGGLSSDGPDRFWGPRGLAIGNDGSVYVTDTGNRRVVAFNPDGTFKLEFNTNGEAQLDEPVGIAAGPDGLLYIADTWNRRVTVFSAEGELIRSWPVQGWISTTIDNKPYIAVDSAGRVFVTDPEGYRVIIFDKQGAPLGVFGQFGEEPNAFGLPNGISVSMDGKIWVADAANLRIAVYPGLDP